MKVFGILNRKGGVMKSTFSVSLAHGLALKGYRVLLVDTDPQANASEMLGLREAGPDDFTLYDWYNRRPATPERVRENLDIIRSGEALAELNIQIGASNRDAGAIMAEALKGLEKSYDYMVIDTAPSISPINRVVAQYADFIIVPVSPHVLAADGLGKLEGELERMGLPRVDAIVPTLVDRRTRLGRRIIEDLGAAYPGRLLPAVPVNAPTAEIPYEGKTVYEHEDCLPVAQAINKIIEVLT